MPWIAPHPAAGLPLNNQYEIFLPVANDLRKAREHRLEQDDVWNMSSGWHSPAGEKIVRSVGNITLVYTLIEPLGAQGSACKFRVDFYSTNPPVAWIYSSFCPDTLQHNFESTVLVYPN